jgi:hypothetical protein
MFQWQVGRDSWSQHPLPLDGEGILQIVLFKVEMFVMDCLVRLHTVCLAPTLSMQEIDVAWPRWGQGCGHEFQAMVGGLWGHASLG